MKWRTGSQSFRFASFVGHVFNVPGTEGCGNFPWRAERSFNRKPQACVFALTALSDPSMPNAHACGLRLNDFSLPKTFAAPEQSP